MSSCGGACSQTCSTEDLQTICLLDRGIYTFRWICCVDPPPRAPVRVQAKLDDKDVHSSSLKSTNLSPPAAVAKGAEEVEAEVVDVPHGEKAAPRRN